MNGLHHVVKTALREVETRMRRWIARVAALYPRSWREEYGNEFDALLDDVKPGWRVFANVLGGAMKMHLTLEPTG